jgi:hypothetical protein
MARGAVARDAAAADVDPVSARTDALIHGIDEHLIIPCTENEWPADCEVKTIRIQRAVGLYYVHPDADLESELKLMNASLVEDGILYDEIVDE